MASPTQCTCVWVNGSWWWTGRPGVLQSMGSQSWTRLSDWTELISRREIHSPYRGLPSPYILWPLHRGLSNLVLYLLRLFFYYVLTSLHSFCFSNTLPCFHLCALLLLFFLPGFPCSWCGSSFSLFRSQVKCVSQSLFLTSISNPVLTAFTLSLCIPLPTLSISYRTLPLDHELQEGTALLCLFAATSPTPEKGLQYSSCSISIYWMNLTSKVWRRTERSISSIQFG